MGGGDLEENNNGSLLHPFIPEAYFPLAGLSLVLHIIQLLPIRDPFSDQIKESTMSKKINK